MQKNISQTLSRRFNVALLSLSSLVILSAALLPGLRAVVEADAYDDQINALQAQNNSTKSTVNSLQAQAASYHDAINILQQQISTLQDSINSNLAQQADLQAKIVAGQQQIDQEKSVLGNSIKTMYVDGTPSTIELLATSKDLSSFVDKQEYRTKVQSNIQDTLQKIADLQKQLQTQKLEVDKLLTDQQTQQSQLASAQTQQTNMLNYNQAQQDAYNAQISSNASKILSLRQQQIIENNKYNIGDFKGAAGNGGYPNVWANASQDSLIDSWGMYNRECVSYTAFRVHQDYLSGKDSRDMPYWGGVGNANQWDGDARAAGIPVDTNPTPGSIAISNAGAYGHAMYVEAVKGNEIYVQQYNQQLNGQYSEGWRYTTGLVFLHF